MKYTDLVKNLDSQRVFRVHVRFHVHVHVRGKNNWDEIELMMIGTENLSLIMNDGHGQRRRLIRNLKSAMKLPTLL